MFLVLTPGGSQRKAEVDKGMGWDDLSVCTDVNKTAAGHEIAPGSEKQEETGGRSTGRTE